LLYGWSFLSGIENDAALKQSLSGALEILIGKQNKLGEFVFKNPGSRKHQNQMYALWGIAKAAQVLKRSDCLPALERTLDAAISRRMLPSGAFVWSNPGAFEKLFKGAAGKLAGVTPHWKMLFECHQTFFANAVLHYYQAGGKKDYNQYISRAMDWIYKNNILGKNLVDESGIGLPARMMAIGGQTDINQQRFKGAYEVGSYIMALVGIAGL